MRLRTKGALILFAGLFFGISSFGQAPLRLDVVLEGPWLFHVEPSFPTTAGTSAVLVAIAPKVAGHNLPLFSAGDGATIHAFGIYCVAFDDGCKPNTITTLNKDGYALPSPVPVSKPTGWNWRSYASSAYVIILPMPDSYSNDGLYPMTFQSSFPSATTLGKTTSSGPHSIGIVLHYANGPQKIGLLGCSGTPSVSTCNSPSVVDEDNSGTLQIGIKSHEDPANPDTCDYHVHRAYHRMLNLLDPLLTNNFDKAYMDVPSYGSCTPCDPQQDTVPSDCATKPLESMAYDPVAPMVGPTLESLVSLLQKINVKEGERDKLLLTLPIQSEGLQRKFPRRSQLQKLKETLVLSQTAATNLLRALKDKTKADAATNWNVALDLEAAVALERDLISTADDLSVLSISGKDCRAPALIVQ